MSRYNKRRVTKEGRVVRINRDHARTTHIYTTPIFQELNSSDRGQITSIRHQWVLGDRFYKLAQEYYGDSTVWWIIALYNGLPTDAHVPNGATIYIPTPLGRVMSFYGF